MYKAEIAERVLTLVTDTAKAAATVGDLVETSTLSAGTVLRIVGAQILRQILVDPGRIGAMALGAFVGQFVVFLPIAMTFTWLEFRTDLGWMSVEHGALAVVFFVTQFGVGRQLARLAKGRAATLCLILGAINVGTGLLGLHNVSLNMAVWQIPVVIGSVWELRRRVCCA